MRKGFIALAAAAALAVGTLASPQPAKADPISAWWLLPAVFGGMWLGGAVVAGPAYAGPYGYYGRPVGLSNCWTEPRRINGRTRTVQVCY
ncbi:MAG: hypothetical protein WD871_10625 [Xanthobacteraceae bacterium]